MGAAFLRARPLVVAPAALANGLLLASSGAPVLQRLLLGVGLGLALAFFVAERLLLARRRMQERWLATSLGITTLILAMGCAVSGGLASPLLPILPAPTVVAAAGFGRGTVTRVLVGLTLALAVALALLPAPFPAIPAPQSTIMTAISLAALLALAYAGVAGLVAAYVRTGAIMEELRQAAIDEAAARLRATEHVGARVAHDLKNPMAAIKALLQLVRRSATGKAEERLGVAESEVDRMHDIVKDYLAFARPQADLELAPVALRGLADHVVTLLEGRAEAGGLTLRITGPEATVQGDVRRLREALYNLVDNAIAATPAGGSVTIVVEDSGSGVPAHVGQGQAYVTTRPGGTGLGLVIARAAVAQHGGTLELSPRPGGGTRASMRLP